MINAHVSLQHPLAHHQSVHMDILNANFELQAVGVDSSNSCQIFLIKKYEQFATYSGQA